MAIQLVKCYYHPPVFPPKTWYLIIAFIQTLIKVGGIKGLFYVSHVLAVLLPWLNFWVAFHVSSRLMLITSTTEHLPAAY